MGLVATRGDGGGRPKVGSNPPLSQLGFSKVCQGEDRRVGAGCQPSSYSTAFHLLGKQLYNIFEISLIFV